MITPARRVGQRTATIGGMIRARPQAVAEPARVLIVMPSWVGDVVMATPLLRAIRRRFPDSHVTLLLKRYLGDLVDGGDWMDECVYLPPRRPSGESRRATRRLVRELRGRAFDLAIVLPNSFSSAFLAWRIGARRRVGFNRDGRGVLLTDRVEVPNRVRGGYAPMPLVEYYTHLARAIGCESPGDRLELFTTAGCDQRVDGLLHGHGLASGRPRVVLCPGAKFGASKCWLPERFAAVADALVQRRGAAVIISPGPGEEPLAHAIARAMRQPNLVLENPCLTLGELKSLIRGADLLLGNDTGPRHFARAFDVPRVTVFGPTEPRWTDTSHDKEQIVRVEVDCGPCHKKVCPLGHLDCMTRVSVEMVLAACERMLDARC